MATSTATVLIPGTVVHQRYTIQEVRQYHDQYRRYLALDSADRFCLITEFPIHNHDAALQPRLKQLFEQKTSPLLELNHPQLPRFTAAFCEPDGFFLVQDPPQGIPYRKFLKLRQKQGKSLTEPEVIHLLTHLLPALQELHARKLIHCKLSPDCIVLPVPEPKSSDALRAAVRHEVPMLVELGSVDSLARQIAALQTQRSAHDMAPIARLGYAPPEQVQTGRIYPHSDLYGLAVTCLELLTGQPPQKLLDSHTLTWSWQAYTSLSESFEAILGKMLSWQPGDRYATAQEILKALKTMQSSFSVGSSRSKASLAELSAGSILSLESWTIDSFLRPRRTQANQPEPNNSGQERIITARVSKEVTAKETIGNALLGNGLLQTITPRRSSTLQTEPSNEEQVSNQAIATPNLRSDSPSPNSLSNGQWQAWLTLAFLSGSIVATLLFILPSSRLFRQLPQESALDVALEAGIPQNRVPWHLVTWLQARLHQSPSPQSVATASHSPESQSASEEALSPSAQSNSIHADEFLNRDIPIPVYLSATSPEQFLEGSLRILPAQTYFVVGQPGQWLTAELSSAGAELTVLDSELRPLNSASSGTTANKTKQWQGELVGGDRTLFRISGQGNYQLRLTLTPPAP